MAEKKNWWVSALDGEGNVVGEWLVEDSTKGEAEVRADNAIDLMCDYELDGGGFVEDWSMREALVTIEVRGGCVVDVAGLPNGWEYDLVDYDVMDELGMEEAERDRDSVTDV